MLLHIFIPSSAGEAPISCLFSLIPDLKQKRRIPIPMENSASKIFRRSIYTFLQNYLYLTTVAAILSFPFSVSILLSQASFVPKSILYNRLSTLFHAAGFPPSSQLFTFVVFKLSQTISSSIFTLPFSLTFFLISKASIIQSLFKPNHLPHYYSSIFLIFNPLLITYICNSFLILSANATVFCLLFFTFNFLEGSGLSSPNCLLFLSAAAAVVYSLVLANAFIVCSLAIVFSGIERSGGYLAILKACVLMRGRTSAALTLALPINLVLAGIEALFQYRIVRAYCLGQGRMPLAAASSLGIEGMFIAYLYSISLVLDTVVSCMFYKSCKIGSWTVTELELEDRYSYQIEIAEEYTKGYKSLKNSQQLP